MWQVKKMEHSIVSFYDRYHCIFHGISPQTATPTGDLVTETDSKAATARISFIYK